jgi:glycosyltransferase involved in cell wall biosynthesis
VSERLAVLLTTEGTYPFSGGGVSTWCDTLIRNTPGIRYTLLPLMMNPHVEQRFTPPPNVRRMLPVPLWGIEDPAEFITDVPFARLYERTHGMSARVIESEFLPVFTRFLDAILFADPDCDAVGQTFVAMEDYFRRRDYNATMKSPVVWDAFVTRMRLHGRAMAETHPAGERCLPSMFDVTECLRWLYHFLVVLNVRVPRVSVTHSTAAAFCGIPCITAKIRDGVPFVLTEHGVYLREQNLFLSRFRRLFFAKHFLLSLITAVARTNYRFADVIAPVCHYNTRWEVAHGTPRDRIQVIYNGVDPDRFAPDANAVRGSAPAGRGETSGLRVVATARIDPLKDIETFIRVAARVREAKFSIFGAVNDEAYYRRCVELARSLGVEVTMGQATDDVVAAYRSADVVLLTSISEAFPFSVIEAMACGRAVVASDVGGVREALDGCGVVVRPRDTETFAAEVSRLLADEAQRAKLGARAREKVLDRFRIDESVTAYVELYEKLAGERGGGVVEWRSGAGDAAAPLHHSTTPSAASRLAHSAPEAR